MVHMHHPVIRESCKIRSIPAGIFIPVEIPRRPRVPRDSRDPYPHGDLLFTSAFVVTRSACVCVSTCFSQTFDCCSRFRTLSLCLSVLILLQVHHYYALLYCYYAMTATYSTYYIQLRCAFTVSQGLHR